MIRLWINESDVCTVHYYSTIGRKLAASYLDDQTVRASLNGVGPSAGASGSRRRRVRGSP
jgi:hypothetical protein